MGSWGMFSQLPCERCSDGLLPRCLRDPCMCKKCLREVLVRKFLLDKILVDAADIRGRVLDFLDWDWRKQERLWYLSCVLLARISPFKRLTYCSGGMAASISEYETILDRILSFLQ